MEENVGVNIEVGNGPVTEANRWLQWASGFGGLAGLASFLLAVADVLPAGVSPAYGLVLTGVAGVVSALGNALTGWNRGKFAETKVRALAYLPENDPYQESDTVEELIAQLAASQEVEEAFRAADFTGEIPSDSPAAKDGLV